VQAAEQPDDQNDRKRDADQPEQKSSTHCASPKLDKRGSTTLAGLGKFHFLGSNEYRAVAVALRLPYLSSRGFGAYGPRDGISRCWSEMSCDRSSP
jgi:hypothetical protein